jgi:hypothetical protein
MKISQYFLYLVIGLSLSSCLTGEPVQDELVAPPPVNEMSQTTPLPTPDRSLPDGWALSRKPKEDSLEAQCGNYSRKEWKVETENGQVKISPAPHGGKVDEIAKVPAKIREFVEKHRAPGNGTGQLHIEPYENGWLVGSDSGEWGGTLVWYSDNADRKKELIEENIRGIAKLENETLILSGMAHLSIDEGKIWKLVRDASGEFKALLLKDLGSQPQGFVVKDNYLLVALNNKFVRVSLSGEVTILNQTSLTSFYPNSMAITSSGVVYVGARHFVVRFVPAKDGYKEEWLVPQNCQKFFVKEMDCVCGG